MQSHAAPATTTLYRTMVPDEDGRPRVGVKGSMLGVRPGVDIKPDAAGEVAPEQGGMSVTPNDPTLLPRHLRPEALGGHGRLPVFAIDAGLLAPGDLVFRPDPNSPKKHGFVEPAVRMSLSHYQTALAATRPCWKEYSP